MLAAGAVLLGGCSSNLNNFGEPASIAGQSTTSQARQEAPGAPPPGYPAVHDMPPPRNSTVLTDYEQKKLENDLIAARRRVAPDSDKPAKAKTEKGKSDASKSSEAKSSAASQNTGNKPNP
ncbi:MAG TPA: hypothetical protein VJL90_04365 [Pseudorhodoplanes sp.]|nr:hypothetical protein [Pseudorhodoplanes sp.]